MASGPDGGRMTQCVARKPKCRKAAASWWIRRHVPDVAKPTLLMTRNVGIPVRLSVSLYNRKSSYHSIGSLVGELQQRLYFLPLPHGQGSLRPIFRVILGPVIVSLLRLSRYGEGRPRHKQCRLTNAIGRTFKNFARSAGLTA